MTLEEAIKVFDRWVNNEPVIPHAKIHIAARLLIEAAKGVIKFRSGSDTRHLWLLPGETEK